VLGAHYITISTVAVPLDSGRSVAWATPASFLPLRSLPGVPPSFRVASVFLGVQAAAEAPLFPAVGARWNYAFYTHPVPSENPPTPLTL
jgi:hypothetical protein